MDTGDVGAHNMLCQLFHLHLHDHSLCQEGILGLLQVVTKSPGQFFISFLVWDWLSITIAFPDANVSGPSND